VRRFQLVSTAAIAATLSVGAAYGDDTLSAADRSFVAMVSQGGMFEVKAGEAGAKQGSTQDIMDQGTTEAHDHKLVGDKLKSIAAANGIKIADSLNAEFQKKLDSLSALSGAAFDAAYLSDMEEIHAKDGAAFAKEAASGTNPALRAFAAETHRIVVRHIGELKASGPKKS
jgi:putative membrane protein